ncbi:MAG: Guanosine-3',5'-bis(diphosphate) 3'-pyrophosphohydrolase / GTP pyrophosphokinase, (p)ppGpp synthetase II [uncultured Thermoleophilia bacterium]|uniref:Guanosine-3',5'-bis(Diphosphate) 3'-pyrophosphohydrolase / GTP pyrophosphokinase, (P)ppGpp synthetase II n=1 Tax=uncultured Thermoleophilia bacterium TaxID=1497501 RepID=A0A6J4UJI0_9ACTN|nr:MAG: Guanosine-3',5'-bis(diphosphate) 3'-pyrophosphohydrolase / GTP pyrophosphokinase, (p)ppGpp synthetase II [uncultured Thermoleophilia bacterium]
MAATLPAVPERHRELLDELIDDVAAYSPDADLGMLSDAFAFSCAHHEGQLRKSGEEYILHPWGVAKICARLRQPTVVLVAALLHDVIEDTEVSGQDVGVRFGEDVRLLVDGVTKLSKIQFASREENEAENYRKMIMSMAQDIRVIVIKLADRLHNMRTLSYLGKQKQIQKARETLEIYAPLAHRLGIHSLKWELEDLAFATLYPRKYAEIEAMVNERRVDREHFVAEAGTVLRRDLDKVGITSQISGRAKHFYSIFEKMSRRGKEFNEIYDLTAMRVLVGSDKDCYGAIGVIHSLWKPMPGRFKDYVAMPKTNGYQSLHTTVIGPQGKPLEIQVRTSRMHQRAEFGVAAHWLYKDTDHAEAQGQGSTWLRDVVDSAGESDAQAFMDAFLNGLFEEEVYVFTPKGELKALPAGATPLDFAYAVHTDVGHHCVGAKVNGRIVPLASTLSSGDIVEVMTSKAERAPSRDWLKIVRTTRARNKIRQYFAREQREDLEARGRDSLFSALRSNGLPHQKVTASPLLASLIREMGYKKADDFYIALGGGKVPVAQVTTKILHRLKTQEVVAPDTPTDLVKRRGRSRAVDSRTYGIVVEGVAEHDVLVRMAKCCTPVPGDEITGYISVGRGITIHRQDCPNARALLRTPERFTAVEWEGDASQSFRVEVAVDSWDRSRLLEDVGRTFAEHGCNVVEYGGHVADQMARNWYVIEVADVRTLKAVLSGLRQIESVFDAYRVTPNSR